MQSAGETSHFGGNGFQRWFGDFNLQRTYEQSNRLSVKVIDSTVGGFRVTLTLTPTASSRVERSPDMQESARFLDLADPVLERFRPLCC